MNKALWTKIFTYSISLAFACVLLVGFVACNGSTGGNESASDDSRTDDIFSSSSAGTVSVAVVNDSLPVSDTTPFTVTIRGADGSTQSDVPITCDSEAGLAIVEPNTGQGLTDGFGSYSGVIGCAAPGSFRFGCRTPGAGIRKFVTVKCSGGVPDGFAGFPGAGGGGLGGGVSDVDDGNSGEVSITSISVFDNGSIGEDQRPEVDIVQGTCTSGTTSEPEPFFNSFVGITVVNNSNVSIDFNRMRYQVENVDSSGTQFNSNDISLIGDSQSSLDPDGGENRFDAIFAEANSGGKRFIGASSNIGFTGTRNITFRLFGKNAIGEDVTVSGRLAINLNNFNNCSS